MLILLFHESIIVTFVDSAEKINMRKCKLYNIFSNDCNWYTVNEWCVHQYIYMQEIDFSKKVSGSLT